MARLRFFPQAPTKTSGLFIGRHLEPMSFQQTVCNVFLFFSFVGEFPWYEDINELEEKQCGKYFNPLLSSLSKNLTWQRCSCHNSTESDWWSAYALIFFDQGFKCPERSKDVTWHAKWLCCWMIKHPNQQPHITSFLLNHLFPPPFSFGRKRGAAILSRHARENKHSQKAAVINRTSDTKVFAL